MAQIKQTKNSASLAPNLFVIGAPKCGTTSLHAILAQHPQIFMCSPKEPRFFSRDSEYEKGFDWYINTYFKDASRQLVRGEATPTYLYLHEKTVPRIKSLTTAMDVKFIAIFRNPIDRAYSHYWFNRNTKISLPENLSFEDALVAEDERMKNHAEFYSQGIMSQAYFRAGLYADQIDAFIATFGRRNCLLLLTEDLFPEHFKSTVQTIEEFLAIESIGLEYTRNKESIRLRSRVLDKFMRKTRPLQRTINQFIPSYFRTAIKSRITNFNKIPFQYPEMKSSTRALLRQQYRQSIIQLERVLGRDLSHWQ